MVVDLVESVTVRADPERVWLVVTDWEGQGRWVPRTRVRRVPTGRTGVGERIVARTALGPVGFDDPMVVTAWDPPRRCELLHTGRVVRGTGQIAVTAQDGGSRVTWSEQVALPGGPLARVGWPLAAPLIRAGFRRALRRLTALVEAAGPA